MLILTRKISEAVVVGDNITIRVLETKGGQIKLGIDAPDTVTIHREEVYLRILEENKKAAQHTKPDDLSKLSGMMKKNK
jgi:carbon storage regulator